MLPRLQVGEIGPRAEDAKRPKLAPVFVGHDIVGIVGARARVAEASEDFASQTASGDDSIRAVGTCAARDRADLEILPGEGSSLTGGTPDGGLRIELDARGIDRGEEGLHLVVAKRPEDLGRHFDGTGRRFVPVAVIELNEPRDAVGIPGREARLGTALLSRPTITHRSGAGGRSTLGPRARSSARSGMRPMRLVNQLESGTSSIVLTLLRARVRRLADAARRTGSSRAHT